jgi:hypothetical protein
LGDVDVLVVCEKAIGLLYCKLHDTLIHQIANN